MFLNPTILNRLMKQAYKNGLRIGQSEDGWIYLGGYYWEVSVKKEFIPKRTLGDIIALVGELPTTGESFLADKNGNQMEMGRTGIADEQRIERPCAVTNIILIGSGGIQQRLLQDEDTGDILLVNDIFINIISNEIVDQEKGEYYVEIPLWDPAYGILWKNNVCKLHAKLRCDERNEKTLKNLNGLDLTPEVEGC